MLRVYLDQNAWVRLARVHHGLDTDEEGRTALKVIKESRRLGQASYPLSSIHYEETFRQHDPGKRRRLAELMCSVSNFHSMVGAGDMLDFELYEAVALYRGRPAPRRPPVFGRGFAHAFSKEDIDYSQSPYIEAVKRDGFEVTRDRVEFEMLSGPHFVLPGKGVEVPRRTGAERQLRLEREVEKNLNELGRSKRMADRIVLAQEIMDVAQRIPQDLVPVGETRSGIARSRQFYTNFLLSMPAKGVITRMRMTGHQNPNFAWELNDLNDMMALGMAAAYCDVVVAEKKWGDVLQRHHEHSRAKVITNVANLPEELLRLEA